MEFNSVVKTIVENNSNDINTDNIRDNLEYFLCSLVFLNEMIASTVETREEPVIYIDYPPTPVPTPVPTPPTHDKDYNDMILELGSILASYGYAISNNIEISDNFNYSNIAYNNSYNTPVVLSRLKNRRTVGNNFLSSDINVNLPGVDSSQRTSKNQKDVISGVILR